MNDDKTSPGEAAFLEACMQQLPVGVAFFSEDGRLSRYNRVWEEFWRGFLHTAEPGRDVRIEPGMTLEELTPVGADVTFDMAGKATKEGFARQDALVTTPDGKRIYYEILVTPVIEEGRIVGMTNLVANATLRKGSVDEIEQHVLEHSEEAERRRVTAESLGEALAIINSNRPLDEALDFIVDRAGRVLGTDSVALHRIQLHDGVIIPDTQIGQVSSYIADLKIPLYGGAVGEAVRSRRPMAVPDTSVLLDNARRAMPPEQQQLVEKIISKFKSMLGIPVAVKDEDYGVLMFYYPQQRVFSDEDIDIATSFADQVALAVGNARLLEIVEHTAVSEERNRLARELHDAVTQTLFSASMIAEVIPALWERDEQEGRKRLEELRMLTRGALAEMRTLLLELRPVVLEETELDELLRQLSEATTGATRVPVEMEINGRCELPVDTKIAIYRIAQEALNNVSKHAGAANVSLKMDCAPGEVELTISDDGGGFETTGGASDNFGLKIMQERAGAIGARLDIESSPGDGTSIGLAWRERQDS